MAEVTSGETRVDFPKAEFASTYVAGGQRVFRWTGALAFEQTLPPVYKYLGVTVDAPITTYRDEDSNITSFERFQRLASEEQGSSCQVDGENGSVTWVAPRVDSQDEIEYAGPEDDYPDLAILEVRRSDADTAGLEDLIRATATPQVVACAGQIVEQIVSRPITV